MRRDSVGAGAAAAERGERELKRASRNRMYEIKPSEISNGTGITRIASRARKPGDVHGGFSPARVEAGMCRRERKLLRRVH